MSPDPDGMVICMDCANRQRGQYGQMACGRAIAAGISLRNYSEIGSDFASMPQRCSAFVSKGKRNAPAEG